MQNKYVFTEHAKLRMRERGILKADVMYVLLYGFHEKTKDTFHNTNYAWSYAIRGKSEDARDIRVIVSFEANCLFLITVIEIK